MSNMARGKKEALALLLTAAVVLLEVVSAQVPVNEITGFSLSPPYFNLAEGAQISATATCGEDDSGIPRSDLYCKLVGGPTTELPSQTIKGQFCEYCNANDPNTAHPAGNAVDGTERWWQSPPLSRGMRYNEVNVTLDLGQLFHVAYVLIKFANSPRPDLWVLERSVDHGKTYVPWQYFSHLKRDCLEIFGKQPNARIVRDDDQICTTEYSRIVPLENGEIVVSLVNGRPGARNFTYSPVLRDFTKATNIRLRFLRTSTLLGHLISKAQRDPTVTRRYYYSIKDISVGGRCVCHGHALLCGARSPSDRSRLQCECQHNTCGESCDSCCPGFNQKPWRAATANSANECQPCQCHSHTTDCYYDPEVDRRRASLNIYGQYDGGGVCINCQHNTAGVNCERCAEGFYRPYGVQPDSPHACAPCRCDPRTTAGCEDGSGRCFCKPNFTGDSCERCANGHYGFPQCIPYPIHPHTTKSPAGHIVDPDTCPEGQFGPPNCQPCRCDSPGVVRRSCDGQTGKCQCRPGYEGRLCDRCVQGRFNFPYCEACQCSREGSYDESCDQVSGQCRCRPGVTGLRCNRCVDTRSRFPLCDVPTGCVCNPEGTLPERCDPYGRCLCRPEVEGEQCDRCRQGYHSFPYCHACQCSRDGSYDVLCDLGSGQCHCRPGVTGLSCDRCVDERRRFPQCGMPTGCVCNPEGTLPERCDPYGRCLCRPEVEGEQCDRCRQGYHSFPFCHACQCSWDGSYNVTCDPASGQCHCRPGVTGLSCDRCADARRRFPQCDVPTGCVCNADGTVPERCDAYGRCLCRPEVEGDQCERCRQGYHSFPNCQACQCSRVGSYDVTCDQVSGQCHCRPGVTGLSCDRCADVRRRFPQCDVPTDCVCNPEGTLPARCDAYGRCLCRPGVEGERCDRCRQGYHSFPNCQACRCDGTGVAKRDCGPQGECTCRPNFTGRLCEQCAQGYYGYPTCSACQCSRNGSYEVPCDQVSGQCRCRPGVTGLRCDRCVDVRRSFPRCDVPAACRCDGAGVAKRDCGPQGECTCRPNFTGRLCEQCAQGYYGYPTCSACQCSRNGSYEVPCDQVSGQCRCRPGVTGLRCDRCVGTQFPQCDVPTGPVRRCNPGGTDANRVVPSTGQCPCLSGVEGLLCDRCKPLFWNLGAENPSGCIDCQCDTNGTLSGVGECEQKSGKCYCKPNTCGHTCNACKEGYFLHQKKNYFGCQGCQCDVGGAVGKACAEPTGQCQCRKHVVGRTCNQPETNYYFPDLHHMKYEVEDGITPNGRPVRFGYSPQEFPNFSWRGYATMFRGQPEVVLSLSVTPPSDYRIVLRYSTPSRPRRPIKGRILLIDEAHLSSCCNFTANHHSPALQAVCMSPPLTLQSEVRLTVHVDKVRPSPFHFILRFINPGASNVTGRVSANPVRTGEGPQLSTEVLFPPSPTPAFLTVPKSGFAEPFPLTPGKWIIHIRAEDVLLDYLVLLPSSYYEAPILQSKMSNPCTYVITADNRGKNCLLYRHTPMDRFPSALASQGVFSSRGRRKRQARVRRPTPEHPEMAFISGRQSQLQLTLRVPSPGLYVLVLEYASEEDTLQSVNVFLSSLPDSQEPARVDIDSCAYSFLCRGVAVDGRSRVARLQMDLKTDVKLQSPIASFLLYKIYAVPADEFSMEYVDPKELCVSVHGRFADDSQDCVPPQYDLPRSALVLDAAREGRLSIPSGGRKSRQAAPLPLISPPRDGVLLKSPQNEIKFNARVPAPGRYVFVAHFRQPELPFFPAEVLVDGGRPWNGSFNASFCPSISGCRDQVIAENRIALDIPQQDLMVTVTVPPGKAVTLDYILVIPDENYSPEQLKEKPLGKSSDFINQCGENSFYIDSSSSQFCRDSAKSLVAAYNDGALPCGCDASGSTGPTCDPIGGQCTCRPNIIGRQCTAVPLDTTASPTARHATVAGVCVTKLQASASALRRPVAGDGCNQTTGQCSCKDNIDGRQCERCAAGHYRYPECAPCDCNTAGVVPDICDPQTGKCLCKKNVVGAGCDSCRNGTFHFDESNPNGCLSCFCFEVSNECRSSDKRRAKFVDMKNWRLEKPDQEEVPSVFNPASNTVVADVQELPATVKNLHWVAPKTYLGDRVSSYGGYLTYQLKSFGIPSEGMILLDRTPDVLLNRREATLVHKAPLTPTADRLFEGRVQLIESNFRLEGREQPVSRELLIAVLADLDALHIRALYFTQSQRLTLGEVGLEEAALTGSGVASSMVEVCTCPPGYRGDSCQKCAPGYYRERIGLGPGRCVPCSCNGHANECDEATGKCLNCSQNTGGFRCEQCKEGYYGNATSGTCQVCPCPFNVESNSFAVSCEKASGGFLCLCKEGYTGPRCERCAPGYYGDPMALRGSCKPCNCNGNFGSCDSKTGVCKNTLEPKDTTAEQCLECGGCAETLTKDLESLDDMLSKLKSQLDNVNASSAVQERLKKLEEAIAAAKMLVDIYGTSIKNQIPKVEQLEEDAKNLSEDVGLIKKKASENSEKAQKVVDSVDKTHDRAQDLAAGAESIFKKIKDLLKELKDAASGRGDNQPTDDLSKIMRDAENMVRDMKGRDFSDPKKAAEKENSEAKKLLDHVKNELSKQHDQNKEAARHIEGLLKEHEAKLKDLQEALKEAENAVKKANQQNGLNAKALEDLLKKKKALEKEQEQVLDQIKMAKDQLKGTKDLLNMLEDSKEEYEQLAAQLDGAKKDLTKKVNGIAQAANKEDIVEKAEKHAETLNQLAKELQDAVRNASSSSDVRCAVDAIEAYKNITEAIKAADDAAKEAKRAADKALKDVQQTDLTKRAKNLNDLANNLLQSSKEAQVDLKDATDQLQDQKKRLDKAEKQKNVLKSDLLAAQAELNRINRDDVADMIDAAKRTAANANDSATGTMDRLNAIKDEMGKISALPTDPNLGNILDDVENSVKNLTNTIPSLLDKISQIENLSDQLTPTGNVSENIKRIKELIELARDAANRITVPMKFAGDGHVELRTPKDVDDLKAYNALSLLLQRPEAEPGRGDGGRARRQSGGNDLFVLYFGRKDASTDYIGMVLKNNELHCIYKLNGQEKTLVTKSITRSPNVPSYFDKVDFTRIYQDAEVILTQVFTSNTPKNPEKYNVQGEPLKNLLSLDPEDLVFYVGGYPNDFTPPPSLNYPKYIGCIEMTSFNEKNISLYNFKKAINVNPELPCKRYIPPEADWFFEGTGYAKIKIEKETSTLLLKQSVYTRSENALILYIGNKDSFYTVTVEQGYVVFRGRHGDKEFQDKSREKLFPLSKQEDILVVIRSNSKFVVRVGSKTAIDTSFTPGVYKTYYLGGLPSSLRERDGITALPMKGCVRNIEADRRHAEIIAKVGMSKGCPKDYLASRKADFSLGSSLSAPPRGFTLTDDVIVSLGFKSTENDGLLLTNSQAGTGIELAMVNGFVLFKFKDKVWKSNKTYKDGQWHYVTAIKRGNSFELVIDEDDRGQPQTSSSSITANGENVWLGKDNFKGCLANLYTRRPDNLYKPEDLSRFSSTGKVLLDVCSTDRPPLLMMDKRNSTSSRREEEISDDSLSACSLPSLLKDSYRLGGPFSSLTYNVAPQTLHSKPTFSLDVQTNSADGLLLYVASRRENSHLVLYMSKGRIRLSMGKKRHIFNRDKYNDGKWHTVMFSWERRKFRLVVDGLRAHDGLLSPEERGSLDLQSPVYLGSAPLSVQSGEQWKDLPRESIVGCVRNFKMNNQPMTEPAANNGTTPCFDGNTVGGAYFSGNGYAVIEDYFVVGDSFELVFEVRPRTLSGVIFHVGGHSGHRLSLFLRRGEVVVAVNNGVAEYNVSVAPQKPLCDGMFHRVAVIKRNNVIQLDVDTEGRHTVGPSSPISTRNRDLLYVGSIPDIERSTHLPKTSFVGCLQNVQINGNAIFFDKVTRVVGPVNLRECPAS
ncbi:hypothetical protein GJAV_G00091440 [Gymnothorax javanicus]|nr:hypothetical protein GJAV_G00091440 [Gymnothorax javanicus]